VWGDEVVPNWCDCELDIIGSRQERQRFARKAVNAEDRTVLIDFNNFVPVPKELDESGNTRDWCIANWGTKWNLGDDTNIDIDTDSFTIYHFMTAWTPPRPVVLAMSKQFPTLRFDLSFWESGVCFQGEYHVENGVVLKDETSPYHGDRGG
jgi:hypothetical protein